VAQAMVLERAGSELRFREVPCKRPGAGEVLLKVGACAVCRTDLHVVDGELPGASLPLVPGHEIVGEVIETGPGAGVFSTGDRVGVPWLGYSCGRCRYCRSGRENLCGLARFTGYQVDGGYATHVTADERFCFPIPKLYSDVQAAPLLCAGLIGYRSYRMSGEAERLGLYGFGAAAHIVAQVASYEERRVFAFTREGDLQAQSLALELGAEWAGDSESPAPEELDAAIIFAPVGRLIPLALRSVARGGGVVCAGIHMSDVPSFPYNLLWGERWVRSVANLTRRDGREFLELAPRIPLRPRTTEYPLEEANRALEDLRSGRVAGAAVLVPGQA